MDAATPFFGAKISLISKSEIRYEGILYTIDPKESTIALAKVRSFGTENRQAERPVPPRDEIFEFIIFRASDIKDLVVDDAISQPQSQAATAFDDPAIVKSSNSSAPGSNSSSGPSNFPAQSKPNENGQASSDSTKKSQPAAQAPKPAWGGVNLNVQNNAQSQSQSQQNRNQQNRQNNNQARQFDQRNNNFNQGGRGGGFRPQGQGFRTQGFNQQGRFNNNRMGGGGFMRGGRGMSRGGYQSRNNGPIKFAPLPDGEFDFEKAHSDFQMLEEKLKSLKLNGQNGEPADLPSIEGIPSAITVSALEEEEIPTEPCYNKTKSFFDSISCEAVEREKGIVKRVDWKAERSLNKETFGVSSARPNQRYFNNRRGGYGFNNRGSGGFNRGRGGYNNNRRYNNNNHQNRQSSGNSDSAPTTTSVEASA